MLVYRVFPHLPSARPGQPGHPLYEHRPQRGGRIDHPDYFVWYLARQAEAAIGESFANLATWDESMFDFPQLRARRALGTFSLPDDLAVLDLDDPQQLVNRSLRPSHVVARNLPVTRAWGHRIWSEPNTADPAQRQWQAITWWSFHRPTWTVLASWTRPKLEEVEPLSLDHPAVRDAATSLNRLLPR